MKCLTSESWTKTRYMDIIQIADAMQIPVKQALAMRHKHIDGMVAGLEQENEADAQRAADCGDEMEFRFLIESIAFNMAQIKKLERSRPVKPSEGAITDGDVDTARAYPVDQLVKFTHGKATAFCHNDKSPSMFHGFRLNLAVCPVCDRRFNSIDILVHRDGYSFIDAVKHLAGV